MSMPGADFARLLIRATKPQRGQSSDNIFDDAVAEIRLLTGNSGLDERKYSDRRPRTA